MPAAKKSVPPKSLAHSFARKAAVRKPAVPKAAAPATAASDRPAGPAKPEKPKKTKLVRDSFTIPKIEYAVLGELKQRAAKAGRPAKKSEVLRAGVKALAAMGDAALMAALRAVPAIKTRRPAGS